MTIPVHRLALALSEAMGGRVSPNWLIIERNTRDKMWHQFYDQRGSDLMEALRREFFL